MRARFALCAAALVTTVGTAHAEQWVLSPGPFFVGTEVARARHGRPKDPAPGGGIEVSLMHFREQVYGEPYGYGVTSQLAVVSLDGHAAYYGSLGVQGGSFLGLEAGFYGRSAAGERGAEAGVKLAPYVSYGWAWAAFPVEFPIFEGAGTGNTGTHLAALCGFKLPFSVYGPPVLPAAPSHEPTPRTVRDR